jgi:hypothetical protein
MAYVAHHPRFRASVFHADRWRDAFARYRAGIDGTWAASLVFGVIVTLSALVFLVPMAIWP